MINIIIPILVRFIYGVKCIVVLVEIIISVIIFFVVAQSVSFQSVQRNSNKMENIYIYVCVEGKMNHGSLFSYKL